MRRNLRHFQHQKFTHGNYGVLFNITYNTVNQHDLVTNSRSVGYTARSLALLELRADRYDAVRLSAGMVFPFLIYRAE